YVPRREDYSSSPIPLQRAICLRHDDASRMQMQQTLEDEDDNDEDNDDDDDDDDEDDEDDEDDDDEAVDDDDEDHVDASSAATAPDVEYARSRRTLVLGYVTAHETNISELSGVCDKLRLHVSSQTFSRLLSLPFSFSFSVSAVQFLGRR
ncbi:hypothetical protein ALC57_14354, partial [Trachymyrmex cornetzi]